jgi:hypothetical protein
VGHRGHGTGRILDPTKCRSRAAPKHDTRVRQFPHGTMTGGNQPTNIRGINRRRKVLAACCSQPPQPKARSPNSEIVIDRSIHISRSRPSAETAVWAAFCPGVVTRPACKRRWTIPLFSFIMNACL